MLKKKMQKLASENNLPAQNKFEIVNDSSAAEIFGGAAQDCPKLQSCGTFTGDCPNLSLCQRYD